MPSHSPNQAMRRAVLTLLVIALCLASPAQTVVTLVGTGGPELSPNRLGEATLVQSGDQMLLFDTGRGVLDGLYESRIPPQHVTRIFLTHLHSDHIEGLPGLWITPWFLLGRTTPLEVWGPPGTSSMIEGMRSMFAHDLESRPNANLPRAALDIHIHEIVAGDIYNRDGIRVVAIPVEHADGDPAFAYEIRTPDSRILLTGDCTLSEVLESEQGPFDLVVANVAAASNSLRDSPRIKPILAKLLSPEQAAQLFRSTSPRLAVYSHIVKKDMPGASGDREILQRTRNAGYAGPLLVGTDHTRIVLSRQVRILHPSVPLPDFDGPASHF